jgi:two-component system sensor kinase FixL
LPAEAPEFRRGNLFLFGFFTTNRPTQQGREEQTAMDDRIPFNPAEQADHILAAIVEASDDPILVISLEGIVLTWNRGAERLYGYTAEEMIGRSIAALIPAGQSDDLTRILDHINAGKRVTDHEVVRQTKDGRQVVVSLTILPIHDETRRVVGAVTIARDLAAQKRAELDQRTSEMRWRAVIESAVDGIVVIDAKGRIEAFNPAAERLFGYREREVLGRNVTVLMPPPYRDEHDEYLGRYLESGVAKIIGIGREVTGLRRDGTVFPLHLSVGEMSVAGERKFTGILHDLTERVGLEERLRSSEAHWRSIVESAVDGIIVIDAAGRIEAFNPAAERLFGYGEAEVIGRNVNMLMPSPYREEHDGYLRHYLDTGAAKIIGIGREVRARRRDGTSFPVHLAVGEMFVNGQRKFTGILHDLSARVRIEEQLREQAAMAHLGQMAAMIAHEIKNPLAGIRGAVQVLGGRLPPGSRDLAVLNEVVKRIDGLNELMKDLLLFARPPQPRPAVVNIAELVSVTAGLLADDPSVANVRVEVVGVAPPVIADAELLKIVFVNLLVNGAHAMDGAGIIRVSVGTTDGVCHIAFRDDGPGIPKDIREKIFTPFFTTKSKGSGLGLPTAKRLIDAHAGRIDIECPPEGGTIVIVQIPAETPALA